MIRFVLRAVALVLLTGAFATVVLDGTRSIAANALVWSSAETMIRDLAPAALDRLEARMAAWPGRAIVQAGLAHVLALPAFLLLAVLGTLLFWLAQPRRDRFAAVSRR